MSLSESEVARIAHLARLALTEAELVAYQNQLSAVLAHVEMIGQLDLRDVLPTTHAVRRENVVRDDVVRPSLDPADALFNAPEMAEGQFRLQAILEE